MTPTPRLISAKEAAHYFSLPVKTFERLRVGCVCLGTRVLYDRRALDAWLDARSGLDSARDPRSADEPEAALARFIAHQRDAPRNP